MTGDFADFPGRFPVEVIESVQDEKIVIAWEGTEHATAKSTTTVGGAEGAFGNCMGWSGMLAAMRAWVEYGIDLHEGFYT